ncbi:MAG: phage major tail protein, TP901-1 family [Pseudomonadota bacterium]
MGVQSGKDLLLKVDLDGNGDFRTMAGLRATRLTFNSDAIDVTSTESAGGWRELLAGGGVKTASVSGSGVFRDADTDARARQLFFDGAIPVFRVIIPDFGTVEGAFQITSLEYSGTYDGEATYEVSLSSSGELSFAAL